MSDRSPLQKGYSWISPCIMLGNAERALDCYEKVFSFSVEMHTTNGKGQTVWGALKYKDISLMFSGQNAWEGEPKKCPKDSGTPSPMSLYVYCEDVDALHKKAVDYGLKTHQAPEDTFWGDRWCQIEDTEGYLWSFATNIGEFDPSKAPADWK